MSIEMLTYDHDDRDDEHDCLDEEEVLVLDRRLGHETDARPVEHGLDDDRVTGEGADDLPTEQRDVRDAGVAHRVHAEDRRRWVIPLALATFTYWVLSSSIIDERTTIARRPIAGSDRHSAGRIRLWVHGPGPGSRTSAASR